MHGGIFWCSWSSNIPWWPLMLYAQDHIQTTRRTNDSGVWDTFQTNDITTSDGNEVVHVFLYLFMSLHRGRCMEVEDHFSMIVTKWEKPGVRPERSNVSRNTAFSWYWQPALGYSLLLTALVLSRALQAAGRGRRRNERAVQKMHNSYAEDGSGTN